MARFISIEKMNLNSLKIAYGSMELPLQIGDFKITCFVLNDNRNVFPIGGIHKLFGYEGKSDVWLLNILYAISKFSKISKGLLLAYENPIMVCTNTEISTETISMIDSNVFIETCKILIEAKNDGLLGVNLIKVSKIAAAVIHTENQNINCLIADATGFTTFKDHAKLSLQKYIQSQLEDETAQWVKTISDDFYNILFEIHNQDWKTMAMSPEVIGKVFYDVIFCRISTELWMHLNSTQPKRIYKRKHSRPQNNEHPELKKYIDSLMSLLKTSGNNWFIFTQLLNRSFPVKNHYNNKLRFQNTFSKKETLSSFNNSLKKLI